MANSLEAKRERRRRRRIRVRVHTRKCKDKVEGAGSPVDKEALTTRLISLYLRSVSTALVSSFQLMAWFQTCLRFLSFLRCTGYGGNGIIGKLVNNTGNDFRLIDFGREIWWKLERNFSEEIEGRGWWFANDSARKFNVEREVRLEGWLIQALSGKNLKRVERFERKILLK